MRSPKKKSEIIVLKRGETKTLPANKSRSIEIGHRSLIGVKDFGHSIRILGKKIGETNIEVNKKSYHIIVGKKEVVQTYRQLNRWLRNKRGPKLVIESRQIELIGRLLTFSDFENLQKIYR